MVFLLLAWVYIGSMETSPHFNEPPRRRHPEIDKWLHDTAWVAEDHELAMQGLDRLPRPINDGDLAEHQQGLTQDEIDAIFNPEPPYDL